MPLGTTHQTVTTGANFIPEIWTKDVKTAIEENLVLANLVRRFDTDAKNGGDTLHIPAISNLSASAKSANTAVTFSAPTESKVDLSLDQHYYCAFFIEDILKTQSAYQLRQLYTDRAGYAISEQIDTTLANLYSGLSQTTGSGATALTDTKILDGLQLLDEANAPFSDRSFVIRPAGKSDILALDKFSLYQNTNSEEALRKGMIGDIYGMKIYVSTQTPLVTTVAHNLMFQKDAFALAMQMAPRVQSQYFLDFLGDGVVIDALWGVTEFRDTFGVDVQSLNT